MNYAWRLQLKESFSSALVNNKLRNLPFVGVNTKMLGASIPLGLLKYCFINHWIHILSYFSGFINIP